MNEFRESAKFVNVFVSGCIGVGKSTVIDYLRKKFVGNCEIYFVQEYIDFDPNGSAMLEKSLKGELSLKDFQLYIIDQFWLQLQKIHNRKFLSTCVIVWERHPEEALQIFARSLSEEDKQIVQKGIDKMLDTFDIPHLNGKEITTIASFDTRLVTPIHICEWIYNNMLDLIASDNSLSIWIHLHCDVSGVEQCARIRRRGRDMEINEYSGNTKIVKLNIYYWDLFKRLKFEAEAEMLESFN